VPISLMATCFGALAVDSVVIEKGAPFALHTQVAIALHKRREIATATADKGLRSRAP
jgi:hypothetical protein